MVTYVEWDNTNSPAIDPRIAYELVPDSSNNRSLVRVWFSTKKNNGINSQGNTDCDVFINGTWYEASNGNVTITSSWTQTSAKIEKYVSHNADGSKNVTIGVRGYIPGSSDFGVEVSNTISIALADFDRTPGQCLGRSVTDIGPYGFRQDWVTPSDPPGQGILEYQIQTRTGSQTGTIVKSISGITDTEYTFAALSRGTTYYTGIRARNLDGWGPWNSTYGVTTTLDTVPDQPGKPTLVTQANTTIEISPNDPSYVGGGVTGRQYEIATDAAFTSIVQTLTGTGSGNRTFTGLTRSTTYYIRYRIQGSEGWGEFSSTLATSTLGAPPSTPTGYNVYDIAATSAKVATGVIADNGGVVPSKIRIKVSTTNDDSGLVTTLTQNSWAPALLTGLTEGTTYYVAEAAYNTAIGGGWSGYGAWVAFTTSTTVPNEPVLSVDTETGTTISYSWTVPDDLNGATIETYQLRVGSNDGLTANVQNFTIPVGTTSQVVGGLSEGTTYYAQVWTVTDAGTGSSSDVVSHSTTAAAIVEPTWYNDAGTWKNGTWWALPVTQGCFVGAFNLGDDNAYCGYHEGVWRQGTLWYNDNNVWRTG